MKLKFSALTLLAVAALGVMAEPNTMDNPELKVSDKQQFAEVTVKGTVKKVIVRVVDGKALLGDMVLGPSEEAIRDGVDLSPVEPWSKESANQSKQNAHDNHIARATRWPNNTVYYIYDDQLPQTNRKVIQAGMKLISDKTAVRFVPRTLEPNYVRFYRNDDDDCYSEIGMKQGKQDISIGNGCRAGNAAHELLHALGWEHEQMRPDRDNYIRVYFENIQDKYLSEYEKKSSSEVDPAGDYDYDSIMHYPDWAFNKSGMLSQKTMVPLKSGIDPERMGQRRDLSPGDVAAVKHFYPGDPGQVTLNATFSAQQLTIDENGSGNLTLDLAGADLAGVRFYPDSDNTRVIAYNGIDIQAGQGNQRTVRVTPVRGAVGTANVKVRVIAANGKEATASFKLTVLKDKNGGGTGSGSASNYDRSIQYKQGDIVDVNGKRYTLTVRVNNQPGGDYQIWGSYCDPTACGENNPYTYGGWLKAYWAGAGSGGGTTASGNFDEYRQYRSGEQVQFNGRSYTLTVKVDGTRSGNYPIYGSTCAPSRCTSSLPWVNADGRASAYWE
ncbi:M12 family metallopeptidase [Chitinimonas sp. BJB300]|uniref:M12 family metallopeptidase n=1 Tax=Chitinimonas sp. BJB300 TaxID=1559339 RepID=UPI001303F486|nr:M12 family metallopeptidase [Chitinimonas sp. BJB300]